MKAKKIVAKATKAEFQVKFGHLGKTEMETVRFNIIQMIIDTDDKGMTKGNSAILNELQLSTRN